MSNSSSLNRTIPYVVALTGGIGCGKTTVVDLFAQLGVPTFVADSEAARLYEDTAFVAQLRQYFGDKIMQTQGQVDKRALAQIVFADTQKLQQLNALVHPAVMDRFEQWRRQQQASYVLFESAILYEYGFDRVADKVVTVYLEQEERIRRLLQRDHTSREEILARMRNQLPAEEKMRRADYVLLNYEGNPRPRQVKYIHNKLLEDFSLI